MEMKFKNIADLDIIEEMQDGDYVLSIHDGKAVLVPGGGMGGAGLETVTINIADLDLENATETGYAITNSDTIAALNAIESKGAQVFVLNTNIMGYLMSEGALATMYSASPITTYVDYKPLMELQGLSTDLMNCYISSQTELFMFNVSVSYLLFHAVGEIGPALGFPGTDCWTLMYDTASATAFANEEGEA